MDIIAKLKKDLLRKNCCLFFLSLLFSVNTFFYFYLRVYKISFLNFFGIKKIDAFYILAIILFLGTIVYMFKNRLNIVTIVGKFILVFLPMELVLIYGFFNFNLKYEENIFFYTLRPFVGLYLILAGLFFVFKYKKYNTLRDFARDFRKKDQFLAEKTAGQKKKRNFWPAILIFLVLGLNLGFGTYHLDEFAAVDEPLWIYDRIPTFWSNVGDGEFWKTMISDKPGITVALLSGVSLRWTAPVYYKEAKWKVETLKDYISVKSLNFALRFPILLFNCLMLLVFYFLIKKLLGISTALISVILIGLSPLLLGISTIINPDSLLWTLAPLSLIAYFVYLKDKQNKYLYLTGIFLGLAILTKYVANILYIYFFGLIFLEYILNREKYKDTANYFKTALADYFILVFLSLVTFFILLPAAWINIGRILEGTILSEAFYNVWPVFLIAIALILLEIFLFKNEFISPVFSFLSKYKYIFVLIFNLAFVVAIIATLFNVYWGMKFYDLEAILASPKSSKSFAGFFGLTIANFYSLIFGLIPLAFAAMFYTGISNTFKRKISRKTIWSTYVFIFIMLYYFASTIEGVSATVRYQIILYPLAMILSAMGIYRFISNGKVKKYIVPGIAYSVILILSLYSLNFIRPFYFSYASDLLPKEYVLNLKDMGDGSYEAAQYLNNLPDAKDLVVWTDKRGVCNFFQGNCKTGLEQNKNEASFDYYVVSSGREARTTKIISPRAENGHPELIRLDQLYEMDNPEFIVHIGGRPNNFVKVINANSF